LGNEIMARERRTCNQREMIIAIAIAKGGGT
jgi:hypothetical protein